MLSLGDFKCPVKEEIAITSGEWEVLGRHGSNVCSFILLICLVHICYVYVVQLDMTPVF